MLVSLQAYVFYCARLKTLLRDGLPGLPKTAKTFTMEKEEKGEESGLMGQNGPVFLLPKAPGPFFVWCPVQDLPLLHR